MRIKITILIIVILGILAISLFSISLKEAAVKGILNDVSEYNCENDNLCTSCMIDGNTCSCGEHVCNCGNKSVEKSACNLLGTGPNEEVQS